MKYQIKPLVIAVSFIISSVAFADQPIPSNPNETTIQYQGGETNGPIIEKSGNTGINNLVIKDVKIHNIDESQLTGMTTPSLVSLGGNNGSLAGTTPENQQYGDLTVNLDKSTQIIANLTSTNNIIGVYSRTDSAEGTNKITSDATVNITSTGNVIGISAQNLPSASSTGGNRDAILHLTSNSNITVSGGGKSANDGTIAAQAQGDNATIITDSGSKITVNGPKSTSTLTGLDSWGQNGTSSVTNNGTINIDSSLSELTSSTGINSRSSGDNSIIHNGTITIKGNGFNTGIQGYSQNGTVFIKTSKDSLIDINAPSSYINNGIKVSGNSSLNIAGDIKIEEGMAYGISTNDGSSVINHSGNIHVTSKSSAIGISASGNVTGNEGYIYSSGNIKVAGDFAAGIYGFMDATSNIIYDNANGHISALSGTDTATNKSLYGIVNTSLYGEANTIIKNADYLSATDTTGDSKSISTAIQNVSISGESYIGILNAKRITASSTNGSAITLLSMVAMGSGDSRIELSHVDLISAEGNKDVMAISSQNEGAGDSVITIDNTVKQISSTSVTNAGKNAAIHASSNEGNNIIISAAKHISTQGMGNHGILSESKKGNSEVTTSSNISVTGNNSSAIYTTTVNGLNKVSLASGANIQGGAGDNSLASGILMSSQAGNQELNIAKGASVSSLNDSAINSINTGGKTTINNSGIITGYSNFTGTDVTFNNLGGTLNLQDFSSGSKGTISYNIGDTGTGTFNNSGTIQFSANSLDGNTNHVTFNVATFNNNAGGVIDLTGKNPNGKNNLVGDTFSINGNYISNGGSVYLNTLLDDASSNGGKGTSDLLIVNGDVTTGAGGATQLFIKPTTNSLGQLTTGDGIKVVDVTGSSSTDAFKLGRRLTAGAYEYTLNQGAGSDWYLSSFYNPTTGGGGNSGTGQIMYSPSVGAYLANQTAAVEMFQQTLFDRLISASGFDHDATKPLFWLRTSMTHGSRRSVQASFSNRIRSYMMQMGGDLGVWQVNNGYLHVGLMAGYGDAKNTSTSRLTRTEADGKVKGYSTGIYGTWFANQDTNLGLYIDTWSQMGWYRNEVSGEAQIGTKKYNSTVWSNSVEAGYGISLGKAVSREWIATPQLQLTYNSYDADNQTDKNNLHTSNNQASGLATRTGIRLHGRALQKQAVEPFVEMNWLHNTANNQLTFNGDKLRDGLPQNRFEAKVGLQGDINDKWSVSAQVGGQWGQNHFNQYQGQLNVNYKW